MSPQWVVSPDAPAIDKKVLIDEQLGQYVSPWLDEFVSFSERWSPRSFHDFFEANALFVLSTIGARRITFDFGKPRFTNLYIALISRTTMDAKSTSAEIGTATIFQAGLWFLLAPDLTTPQKFINNLTNQVPEDYDRMTTNQQEIIRLKIQTAGQRGWFYDEFGQHINAMMQPAGVMADFRGILRRFDDTPDTYTSSTLSRGDDMVERPYLALLALLTPADLVKHAHIGSPLWGDGFLARFGIITPPANHLAYGQFPKGKRIIPDSLVQPLVRWNQRLGLPTIAIKDVYRNGKLTGEKYADLGPFTPEELDLDNEVYIAAYNYDDALRDLIAKSDQDDLAGNYSRFSEKALRIAALLTSLDNQKKITIPYWARAQAITERWRASLHRLYEQVNDRGEVTETRTLENRILSAISKKGPMTTNDLSRYIKSASSGEIDTAVKDSLKTGILKFSRTRVGTPRYEIA